MSLLHTETLPCPFCGAEAEREIANSVAAVRRPDLRAAILDGSFQKIVCDSCGKTFRINPTLTYMDTQRGTWILTLPCNQRPLWDSFESGALSIFNDSFGTSAPPAARGLGSRLRARVTFGWSGLREKLLCEEFGIDDTTLELLKLLLLRTIEAGNLAQNAALRLIARNQAGDLVLAWLTDATEGGTEIIEVPASLLADIAGDKAWDAARAELTNGPFVDAGKLLVPPELPIPA
jgi:hypothetical protein